MLLTKKQTIAIKTKKKRINLYYGSVRSGKTHYSIIEWAMYVASCPKNSEFLMVGKTGTTLNRNCLRLLQEFEPTFTYSLGMKKGELYGRTIWLEGASDERAENKIRGMTLQGAYIDELTLVPKGFYYMLLSRLSLKGSKLFATTNPDSPNNYVNTEIILNDKISKNVIKFTIDDNDFLDPEYVREIKNEYSGVFYDRFILGNFVRAEGVIHREYIDNEREFYMDVPHEYIRKLSTISIGIDYGASQAKSVFKAIGLTQGFTHVIALEEHDIEDTHEPENLYAQFHKFYDRMTEKYGRVHFAFADWGGLGSVITNGLITYANRNALNIKIQDCQKGRVFDRIQLSNQLIAQRRLIVSKNCPNLHKALLDAVWDEKKTDERLDDNTSDIDSLDAFEYAIYPFAEHLIRRR